MAEEKFDDLDELDDFDAKDASYEVWVILYDKDEQCIDSMFIKDFDDPDPAVSWAKNFVNKIDMGETKLETNNPDAYYAEITVETVVAVDEDSTENVATLFLEAIKLIKD